MPSTDAQVGPLRGALDKITRPPILTISAGLFVVLALLMQLVSLATLPPVDACEGNPRTGDFLAFYTGAELIASGQGAHLYDLDIQERTQLAILDYPAQGWQPFVNPPGLAILLAWLRPFGYRSSFLVFDAVSVGLFALGAWRIRRHLPQVTATPLTAVTTLVAAMSFLPVVHTMLGGQNTVITLGLLAVGYSAWRDGQGVLLGVCVGLLSYKPQYAVIFGPLLLLGREWVAAAVAIALGFGHYALGALYLGWDWPLVMQETLEVYEPVERAIEGPYHFSLPRFAHYSLPPGWVTPFTTVTVLAVLGTSLWAAGRLDRDDPELGTKWGLWLCTAMLVSPHLNDYDSGLLVLPVVLLVERMLATTGGNPSLGFRLVVLAGWLSYLAKELAVALHFQPLVITLLVCWSLCLARLVRARSLVVG
jgi:hypothetical protein